MTTANGRPRYTWLRIVGRMLRAALLAYVLFLIALMFFEDKLIYFPSPANDGPEWTPAGLRFEDAWMVTADGVKIHGWYLPCDDPRATVLFAHGNAGNITDREDIMRSLQIGLRVEALFFDYRGYGKSAGSPHETGLLADGRAARKWLAEKARISENEIVLMGESIGCGVVVDMAAQDGARGLILENAFTSLPDVAAPTMPFVPVRLLMRTRFDNLRKIANYHGPLLQFHGTGDTIIPFSLGKRLFESANEPKTFVEVPGADHNDPRTPLFFRELDKFVRNLPPVKKP